MKKQEYYEQETECNLDREHEFYAQLHIQIFYLGHKVTFKTSIRKFKSRDIHYDLLL
jgi:hypothetical protein